MTASAAAAVPADGPHLAELANGRAQWSFDLSAALAEARASNRLVLVCFNMDGEQANERALAMYRSEDFAEATRDVICVLCSGDEHDDAGAMCSRFAVGTCKDHRDCERATRRHFFGALRDNVAPQHLLLYPDGLVAWHAVYEVAPAQLFKAIEGSRRLASQPLAQRLRSQRGFLEQTGRRAAKGVATAYMQVQACLAQTPPEHFLAALKVLSPDVCERILRDLGGYTREHAAPLLEASRKHTKKEVRQLAESVMRGFESITEASPAPVSHEAAAAKAETLSQPLKVLAPADDLDRVHWVGDKLSLQELRDQVTVVWFFMPDAAGLDTELAAMNEFAAAHSAEGIRVVGLACVQRPGEVLERLAQLDSRFPLGCYQATNSAKLFDVAMFPTWVVLDPETNVVHRSPQDGRAFDWSEGRDLAVRMASSPIYSSRLAAAPAPARR
ncbi:MAG: TlpA disulfide reductase family protein [Planctomycetota bacterium]